MKVMIAGSIAVEIGDMLVAAGMSVGRLVVAGIGVACCGRLIGVDEREVAVVGSKQHLRAGLVRLLVGPR